MNNIDKKYTLKEAYELLNQAYTYLITDNIYKGLTLEQKKSLYEGFYAACHFLMNLSKDSVLRNDLKTKKEIIDKKYATNITYTNYNMLKVHKILANKALLPPLIPPHPA